MSNPNKTVSYGTNGFSVVYTDTNNKTWYKYEDTAITQLSSELNRIQTTGTSYSKKNVQDDFPLNLSAKQVKLYRLALYGVEALSEKEHEQNKFQQKLEGMRKQSIMRRQGRTQRYINCWKQNIISALADSFFLKMFPNSAITKHFAASTEFTCDRDINPFSFKELGITQRDIINKMISWGSLPANFYQLT